MWREVAFVVVLLTATVNAQLTKAPGNPHFTNAPVNAQLTTAPVNPPFTNAPVNAELTNASANAPFTNAPIKPVALSTVPALPPVPELGLSFLRVLGALILVIAIFLGGVWLFRNGQRLAGRRGRSPLLNVLETRSLGGRQALYVVGYDRERFLLSASPAGVNLLTHLPAADETAPAAAAPQPAVAFGQVLARMMRGGK